MKLLGALCLALSGLTLAAAVAATLWFPAAGPLRKDVLAPPDLTVVLTPAGGGYLIAAQAAPLWQAHTLSLRLRLRTVDPDAGYGYLPVGVKELMPSLGGGFRYDYAEFYGSRPLTGQLAMQSGEPFPVEGRLVGLSAAAGGSEFDCRRVARDVAVSGIVYYCWRSGRVRRRRRGFRVSRPGQAASGRWGRGGRVSATPLRRVLVRRR